MLSETSTVRAMCKIRLMSKKRAMDMMQMLGFNKAIDQLTMICVERENWHVWRGKMGMCGEVKWACVVRENWHVWRGKIGMCGEKLVYKRPEDEG